jgi:hypothetical protein
MGRRVTKDEIADRFARLSGDLIAMGLLFPRTSTNRAFIPITTSNKLKEVPFVLLLMKQWLSIKLAVVCNGNSISIQRDTYRLLAQPVHALTRI